MNGKMSVLVICLKTITYLLLYNLHEFPLTGHLTHNRCFFEFTHLHCLILAKSFKITRKEKLFSVKMQVSACQFAENKLI